MTQERALNYPDLENIDFFVIDEFYKLGLENDSDRFCVTTHPPPTAKFIINEIISHIAMVANKTFRLMDGKHNAHTHSR